MTTTTQEVGARIREARRKQRLSLGDLAASAQISASTLSRIETSKQSPDVDVLMALARSLGVEPAHLLGDEEDGRDRGAFVRRLAANRANNRAELMRPASRPPRKKDLGLVVDDLLSTLDILRDELEQVARASRRRRKG